MKEDIFSRLSIKNYNNELEKILEAKDFSKDVKNLLLSMLYKVETAYHDYSKVKRNVESKNSFINTILENIKMCKKIEIIKSTSKQAKEFEKQNRLFKINKEKKEILSFPNEKSLLYAIYYIGNEKMYLNEKYNYIRITLPAMLNEGKDNNKVEIIRDFNSWSWNSVAKEITNLNGNLIYQNLQILLSYEKLEEWMKEKEDTDKLDTLKKMLINIYPEEEITEFLDLIYKISIQIYSKKNEIENTRLNDEFKYVELEYNKIKNKRAFTSSITGKKKMLLNKIREIDSKLQNEDTLKKEFDSRNEKLPKYSKLIDLEHLKRVLTKERNKALKDIEECNKIMEPQNYVEEKQRLEKEYKILEYLKKEDISKEILKIQKIFIKCFKKKIEASKGKKEIMENIYLARYYLFIPYDEENYIKDVTSLKKDISELINVIIEKCKLEKILNKNILKSKKLEEKIIQELLKTRIIDLEQVQFEIVQEKSKIIIKLYDNDNEYLEKAIEMKKEDDDKIKQMKRNKLFLL